MAIAKSNRIWNRPLLSLDDISVGVNGRRVKRTSSRLKGPLEIVTSTMFLIISLLQAAWRCTALPGFYL